MSANGPSRVYTMAEARRLLGVHENTIRCAEREGRIRSTRRDELGHRVFTDEQIEQLRTYFGRIR